MATGDHMMRGQAAPGTGCTSRFVEYRSGRQARDFVKCIDPECPINKQWEGFSKPKPMQPPHCHPVF